MGVLVYRLGLIHALNLLVVTLFRSVVLLVKIQPRTASHTA